MYGKLFQYSYQDIHEFNQLELWSKILNRIVELGEKIANPCRIDNNPQCFLREWNGLILLTDFAYPSYNKYTAIHAYKDIQNLSSLNQAASHLISDVKPTQKTTNIKQVQKNNTSRAEIYFESYLYNNLPTFLPRDKQYWSSRGITREQLERHGIYSVYKYTINGHTFYPNDLCYAYVINNNIKIYQPNNTKHKWTSNTCVNDIWTSSNFPPSNICILTKSLKDLMVLENLYPDIDIISFQNEGVIPDLSIFSMYDYIYILYDNDKTGIKQSKLIRKQLSAIVNCESIFIPKEFDCKDIDELYIKYGRDICKEVMNILLQTTEETTNTKLVPSLIYL